MESTLDEVDVSEIQRKKFNAESDEVDSDSFSMSTESFSLNEEDSSSQAMAEGLA